MSATGPNPLKVAWSIWRARRVADPDPADGASRATQPISHEKLRPVLEALQGGGVPAVAGNPNDLEAYLESRRGIDPDELSTAGAVAFWLNLYNAGAISLAVRAQGAGDASVLRVPGGFSSPFTTVAGEQLSLDQIEHGKIRRFGDPRIHGALVCGSVSCPTLRFEPYEEDRVGDQLDDQMRHFMAAGAAVADRERTTLHLSRVFLWYGGDFARPHKMPTWLPPRKRWLRDAVRPWLAADVARWVVEKEPRVEFQPYDWGLACTVR